MIVFVKRIMREDRRRMVMQSKIREDLTPRAFGTILGTATIPSWPLFKCRMVSRNAKYEVGENFLSDDYLPYLNNSVQSISGYALDDVAASYLIFLLVEGNVAWDGAFHNSENEFSKQPQNNVYWTGQC
jgi:hypothetical protein